MKILYRHILIVFILCATLGVPMFVSAQVARQVISVTPPLFQISVEPGNLWQSTIRVVNGNSYELPVFAELVNFAPVGEKGQGKFVPLISDDTSSTLAEWIEISPGPYVIPPEQSMDIPFFIEVPKDAPPGGHFAAVLIGTQQMEGNSESYVVQTSQAVTSLFFLRIEGDVIENGGIREFTVDETFVDAPEASFILRFENKGNVHLQPRGDIIITNMWGKERGIIPINQKTHFGNVLPQSIREFNFSWNGAASLADIGRYKAVVTLAYGENGIQSDHQATYFWVIPLKATLITLGLIAAFILFMIWAIRLYIRKTLALAGVNVTAHRDTEIQNQIIDKKEAAPDLKGNQQKRVRLSNYQQMSAPIRRGASDLRSRLREVREFFDVFRVIIVFVINYKLFFGSVLVCISAFILIVYYISTVSVDQRSFEVTISEDGIDRIVDSEEILMTRLQDTEVNVPRTDQPFIFNVVNVSGEPGTAAELAVTIENSGYVIEPLITSTEISEVSILYYDTSLELEASAVRDLVGNDLELISVENKLDTNLGLPIIELRIGSDRIDQ